MARERAHGRVAVGVENGEGDAAGLGEDGGGKLRARAVLSDEAFARAVDEDHALDGGGGADEAAVLRAAGEKLEEVHADGGRADVLERRDQVARGAGQVRRAKVPEPRGEAPDEFGVCAESARGHHDAAPGADEEAPSVHALGLDAEDGALEPVADDAQHLRARSDRDAKLAALEEERTDVARALGFGRTVRAGPEGAVDLIDAGLEPHAELLEPGERTGRTRGDGLDELRIRTPAARLEHLAGVQLGRVLDAERLLDRGVDRIEGVGKTRVAAHVLGLLEDDDVL